MKTIKKSLAMPLLALPLIQALAGPFPAPADPIIYATASAGGSLVKVEWPSAPTVVGNRYTLAVEAAGPARFFRLIRR